MPSSTWNVCLLWTMLASLLSIATSQKERFIVTIDGGSSGSRVHVHKVLEPTQDRPIPIILSAVNHKIKPGLSSFADKASTVGDDHVRDLLTFAYEKVPSHCWNETPIYLKATAGMRSIPPEKADRILAVVRASLAASPFRFEDDWARIISGVDEAKFSWIAVNYLSQKLGTGSDTHTDLFGVIEMGGASLQISYPVPEPTANETNERIVQVTLGAKTYHLYAHSFLGYGVDQAQELLAKNEPTKVATCYPRGSTISHIDAQGAGDYPQCYQAMDSILQQSTCPSQERAQQRCALQGTMLPYWDPSRIQFYAIENFYYTTSFLTENANDLSLLPQKGHDYCANNWDALRSDYESEREDASALMRYCFSAAYIMALLDRGFGIDLKQHIQVARTVGGTDIDWAVGSVIQDVLQLHHEQLESSSGGIDIDTTNSTPIMVAKMLAPFGLLLLTGLVVARRRREKKNKLLQWHL